MENCARIFLVVSFLRHMKPVKIDVFSLPYIFYVISQTFKACKENHTTGGKHIILGRPVLPAGLAAEPRSHPSRSPPGARAMSSSSLRGCPGTELAHSLLSSRPWQQLIA